MPSKISLCYLIALAKTSNTVLNKVGENGYPSLDLLIWDEKALLLSIVLALGLSYMALLCWICPSYIHFTENFCHNRCWFLSNTFPAATKMIIWFLSFILLMWQITFIDVKPSLDSWNKYYLIMVCDPFNSLLNLVS